MYLSVPGYVYKITFKETGEYYFGSRVANIKANRLPEKDLWNKYFTSSKKVKALIKKFGAEAFCAEIVFVNTDPEEVFWYEQYIIKEHIQNRECLNDHFKDKESGHKIWSTHGKEPWNKGLPSLTKGVSRTPETIELMTRNRKGKNIGQIPWNKGKKNVYSTETLEKMGSSSKGKSGEKNGFYGKNHSAETKAVLREMQKRQVECPHCGKIGGISIMKRWHFDKCHLKK